MSVSIKVNLASLVDVSVVSLGKKKDVPCLIIPIPQNHLFVGEKGGVYLDLTGFPFENKKADSKDTHLVKQSLPKDIYAAMSDEDKKKMPIMGNMIDWDANGGGGGKSEAGATKVGDLDDLPFS